MGAYYSISNNSEIKRRSDDLEKFQVILNSLKQDVIESIEAINSLLYQVEVLTRELNFKDSKISTLELEKKHLLHSIEEYNTDAAQALKQCDDVMSLRFAELKRIFSEKEKKGNYERFGLSIGKFSPVGRFQPIVTNLVAEVTKPAPDFKGTAVVNGAFKEIRLCDYKGKYVVLFFYPHDFTLDSTSEIIAFSEAASEFETLNTEVIAASTDSHFSHLAWINTPRKKGGLGSLNIPLLSDSSKSIARDYGVLLDSGIALRGLFLIDPQGIIRQITINDLPVGRSVEEVVRLIKTFQFVEKDDEECKADWKPDAPTIKPDPVKAVE